MILPLMSIARRPVTRDSSIAWRKADWARSASSAALRPVMSWATAYISFSSGTEFTLQASHL